MNSRLRPLACVLAPGLWALLPGCVPPAAPGPGGGGSTTGTLLATLSLGTDPKSIAVDPATGKAYVADGMRARRMDLASRSFQPRDASGGVFYCVDPEDELIGEINPATGLITRMFESPRFNVNGLLIAGQPFGLTYDPATKTLLMIDVGGGGRRAVIFKIDPQTGEYEQMGETGLQSSMPAGMDGATSLARSPSSGRLYTVDFGPEDKLWRFDTSLTTAAVVSDQFIGSTDIQGLSFSPDGVLYGLTPGRNVHSSLATIDLTTGLATKVATVPVLVPFSLAFKPDGTLWSVELLNDTLIQINPDTGRIERQFPTLKILKTWPFSGGYFFDVVNGLTFAPEGGTDATVPGSREIESVGIDGNGGMLAATSDKVFAFDSAMNSRGGGVAVGPIKTFRSIVYNPDNGMAYVRDGLARTVYEIDPNDPSHLREIQYEDPPDGGNQFATPRQPEMQIDTTTGTLYLVHNSDVYAVDLSAGTAEKLAVDLDAQAVVVDSARRRLHVNTLLGGPENCSTIRTYDLDTLASIGEVCVGVQIFGMAFDPTRNRMAANARFEIPTFDTRVFLIDLSTHSMIPYDLLVPSSEGTDAAFYACMGIDPDRNRLLVGIGGANPRVEFHQLP